MSVDQSTTSKRCIECQVIKPAEEYSAERRNRDGLQGRCKACCKAVRKSVAAPPASYKPPASKPCTRCGVDKPLAEFSPHRAAWDGRQSQCRGCDNARYKIRAGSPEGKARIAAWETRSKLKYRYGITDEEFNRLLEQQGGRCALCDKPPLGGRKTKRLLVDHDHVTGRVRGAICHKCNSALAAFGDDLDGIMKVVAYLQRTS